MRAGGMDHRVTLQRRVLTRNASGEDVATFEDVATVWAEKRDIRGREYFAASQERSEVTTRWFIRYRDDASVLHRLVYGAVAYDIEWAAEIGRHEGLELYTIARVP